jgi:hypothetical protein
VALCESPQPTSQIAGLRVGSSLARWEEVGGGQKWPVCQASMCIKPLALCLVLGGAGLVGGLYSRLFHALIEQELCCWKGTVRHEIEGP